VGAPDTIEPIPPARTIGIIDLGSNTARIVILKYRAGYAYHIDSEIREIVRLRQGMTENGLSADAIQRAYHTLRLFKHFADAVKADTVIATATSAVREAGDGIEFVRHVEEEIGLKLRILSGEEEAYYGVLGVLNAVPMQDGIVLDIGGGSAQLSQVESGKFVRGQALTLGSLALSERFIQNDPITKKEVKKIQKEIESQLDSLEWLKQSEGLLVGLGGTIRNLAQIEASRVGYPLQRIGGFRLTRAVIDALVELLVTLPVAQRQQMRGLKSDRADIILAGALVLQAVMHRYQFPDLLISPNGLREGLFFEQFWAGQAYPAPESVRDFSVLNMARFYGYHEQHAYHVQHLALRLFDGFAPLHGYDHAARTLLANAALLHDLGTIISYNDHHKHSENLIVSSGLPGYTPRETALIALLARYHRKGNPGTGIYDSLMHTGDEKLLAWLSALLRLAEYLERGRDGNVYDLSVTLHPADVQIHLQAHEYPFVELWESEKNALELLKKVVGRTVTLRALEPIAVK
jgi:exopolyphosphatase / guanosine-5'-triphosphate,3'-diphosphate pyrophosphatase